MSKLTLKTEGDTHVVVPPHFAAPPEAVYRSHADPQLIQKWTAERCPSVSPHLSRYRNSTSAPRWITAAPAIPVTAETNAGLAPRRFHSSWMAW